ncbi:hypothetical protein CC79DRAFT_187862 [Sarocladium strictum]
MTVRMWLGPDARGSSVQFRRLFGPLQPPCRLVQGVCNLPGLLVLLISPTQFPLGGCIEVSTRTTAITSTQWEHRHSSLRNRLAHAPHALQDNARLISCSFHGAVWIYKQHLGSAGASPTPLPHPFPLGPARRLLDLVARVSVRSFFFCLSWCTRQSLRYWGWAMRSVAGWSLSTTDPVRGSAQCPDPGHLYLSSVSHLPDSGLS